MPWVPSEEQNAATIAGKQAEGWTFVRHTTATLMPPKMQFYRFKDVGDQAGLTP